MVWRDVERYYISHLYNDLLQDPGDQRLGRAIHNDLLLDPGSQGLGGAIHNDLLDSGGATD